MSNDTNGPEGPEDIAAAPPEETGTTGKEGDKAGEKSAEAQPKDGAEGGTEAGGSADTSPWESLEALKAENAELRERLLRAMAEMENLRKRTEREKADTARYAISDFARDVLTIGDNIQRAIDAVPAEAAEKDPALRSFLEGVELMERELLSVLERHGVTRLEPKGEILDPNKHQAMYEVENPDIPAKTIVEVLQAGYMIGDRLLRPALVGVSKGGPRAPKEASEPAASPGAGPATGGDEPEAPGAEPAAEAETSPAGASGKGAGRGEGAPEAANDDQPEPPRASDGADTDRSDVPKTRRIDIKTAGETADPSEEPAT